MLAMYIIFSLFIFLNMMMYLDKRKFTFSHRVLFHSFCVNYYLPFAVHILIHSASGPRLTLPTLVGHHTAGLHHIVQGR